MNKKLTEVLNWSIEWSLNCTCENVIIINQNTFSQ